MNILGAESFTLTPDVNGQLVMLNGGGNAVMTSGATGARPGAGNVGNIFVDTTLNGIYRDNGTSWVLLIPATSGHVLQVISGTIPAITGTTQITTALTAAPTITDGFQIWSAAITPLVSTSRLIISFSLTTSHSVASRTLVASVFSGSTNVGAVAAITPTTANLPIAIPYHNVWSPGSTAAITFTCRIGANGAGTVSVSEFNGTTNTLGGVAVSDFTIMEVQ